MRSRLAAAIAVGVLSGAAVALDATSADAFCRTTSVSVSADFNPRSGQCWTQGLPLWWRNRCVSYHIHRDASRQIALGDAEQIIATAFSKWAGATCVTDGSGSARPSIDLSYGGTVNCGLVQYNSDSGNQHVIVFRDNDWPHNDANNTLALTTVTFNPDTGEIYDADMEVNTAQTRMTLTDPVPESGFDFRSVMTHEAGHFLGLAHSGDSRATMFANYEPGSTRMRELTLDDVEGICAVYPSNGTRAVDTSVAAEGSLAGETCNPTPRKGFSKECRSAPAKKSGCAIAPTPLDPGGSAYAVGGAAIGALILAERRRKGIRRG